MSSTYRSQQVSLPVAVRNARCSNRSIEKFVFTGQLPIVKFHKIRDFTQPSKFGWLLFLFWRFLFGGLARQSIPDVSTRISSATSCDKLRITVSTLAIISSIGNVVGDIAKFLPLARTDVSSMVNTLFDRLVTVQTVVSAVSLDFSFKISLCIGSPSISGFHCVEC